MSLHVVALSGGKDSTAMALRLKEMHPEVDFTYVCTPTGNEPDALFEHWRKLEGMLGKPIIHITGQHSLVGLILKEKMLPNWRSRFCTVDLKIAPYAAWLAIQAQQHGEVISYVGLRADEEERAGGDYSKVPGIVTRYPMREWEWGLNDVWGYLAKRGIDIPARTDCKLCFFQTLGEWWELWKSDPEGFEQGVMLEDMLGHTFRSEQRDTWPASMRGLREEFERGRIPRGAEVNLNLFGSLKCRVCRL